MRESSPFFPGLGLWEQIFQPKPRDPGSPKLRMVSWNLNTKYYAFRFGDWTPQIIIWEYNWSPRQRFDGEKMEVPENFRPCACSSWSPNRTPRSSTGGNVPRRCWPLRFQCIFGRWKKLGWAWNDLGGGIQDLLYIYICSPQFPGKKMIQFDDLHIFLKNRLVVQPTTK